MIDVALDPHGKFVFENGNPRILTGSEALAQRLRFRLRTLRGEWFLDRTYGLPYLERLRLKRHARFIANDIRKAILADTEVLDVVQLISDFDAAYRALHVRCTIRSKHGILHLDFSDVLQSRG